VAVPRLEPRWAERLERAMDRWDQELPVLHQFVLPGGTRAAAALHLARAVCRRAERRVVALAAQAEVDPNALVYLNRLSDLLFVAARLANHRAGQAETHWDPKAAR
jgi:cob(I)alamin adenosyltransferase